MPDNIKNGNMSAKGSEQFPATAVTAAAAVDVKSNMATGVTSHRQMCEGAYFCECCLWYV
jgi:hypothetical protein